MPRGRRLLRTLWELDGTDSVGGTTTLTGPALQRVDKGATLLPLAVLKELGSPRGSEEGSATIVPIGGIGPMSAPTQSVATTVGNQGTLHGTAKQKRMIRTNGMKEKKRPKKRTLFPSPSLKRLKKKTKRTEKGRRGSS